MKQGKSITELAQELERQASSKKDLVADTRTMKVHANGNMTLQIQTGADVMTDPVDATMPHYENFPINRHALQQIHSRLKIPAKYADKMIEEAPELYARNVNHWFQEKPENRMIRTLDGNVRAFLSNRYQRIDNIEVARIVLPVLAELRNAQGLEIVSCNVTEKRLYIKAVASLIEGEVKTGDIVQAGVEISNSEVGSGALSVCPLLYRLVCLNGMKVNDSKYRRHHVGAGEDMNGETYKLLSDEAIQADDRAILLKVRDVVRGALNREVFDTNLNRLLIASENKISGNPVKAVEVLANNYVLNQDESSGILRHLIEGGDLSQWGMINAFTRFSQDVEDYDRASDFESIGGKVLDLEPKEWNAVAVAA